MRFFLSLLVVFAMAIFTSSQDAHTRKDLEDDSIIYNGEKYRTVDNIHSRYLREASGEEIRETGDVDGSGTEVRDRRDVSEGESVEDAIFKRDAEGSGVGVSRARRSVSSESSEEVEGSGHGSGQAVKV